MENMNEFEPQLKEDKKDVVLDWTREALRSAAATLGVGGGGHDFDVRRIAKTIEYMNFFELYKGVAVEIGSLEYLVSQVIWQYFPDAKPIGTSHDLRIEPLDFLDNSVDSLICLEVIEHLSDTPYQQATTLNGLFYFLEDLYRVLKVGGRALITTPNAASLWTIQRALLNEPPMMYEWHFREFTVRELRQILESIGFEIVIMKTEYMWHRWDFEPIRQFMSSQGYSVDDRGDDVFIVVSKPVNQIRKNHNLNFPI
jgi:predicted SAM-dependent methyltransferase